MSELSPWETKSCFLESQTGGSGAFWKCPLQGNSMTFPGSPVHSMVGDALHPPHIGVISGVGWVWLMAFPPRSGTEDALTRPTDSVKRSVSGITIIIVNILNALV